MKKITRRNFMAQASRAAVASTVLTAFPASSGRQNSSLQKKISPGDKIHLALIGCGGMGKTNLNAFLRIREAEFLAVADVDERHLAEGLKIIQDSRNRKPDGYKDFRRIIDRKDIDAVVIATPDHWHALNTIYACQSGKDVYVEKPLATTIEEGRAMVNAARKYKRIVQVGTQQRSARHFSEAVSFVQSGKLGKIRKVHAWAYLDWKGTIGNPADEPPPSHVDYDLWLGPAPERPFNPVRFHHNFRWFWDYSGGLFSDWGAHMIDVVVWALRQDPLSAVSIGGKFGFPDDIRETPDTQQAIIEFPQFSLVWEHMLGCGVGPWQREHGVEFHGEHGILVVDRGGWEVFSETDKLKQPERVFRMTPVPRQEGSGDFHFVHVLNFVDSLKSRQAPAADVEIGHRSAIIYHLGNIAFRLGRHVRWDAKNEQIIGDPEARLLTGRKYRKPWVLPEV